MRIIVCNNGTMPTFPRRKQGLFWGGLWSNHHCPLIIPLIRRLFSLLGNVALVRWGPLRFPCFLPSLTSTFSRYILDVSKRFCLWIHVCVLEFVLSSEILVRNSGFSWWYLSLYLCLFTIQHILYDLCRKQILYGAIFNKWWHLWHFGGSVCLIQRHP